MTDARRWHGRGGPQAARLSDEFMGIVVPILVLGGGWIYWFGFFQTKATVLMAPGAWPFYPLVGWAMWSFHRSVRRPWLVERLEVRLGLMMGTLLAAQFTVIVQLVLWSWDTDFFLAGFSLYGTGLLVCTRRLLPRAHVRFGLHGSIPLAIAMLALFACHPFAWVAGLGGYPLFCVLLYGRATVRAFRAARAARAGALRLGPLIAWIAAYQLAWGLALRITVSIYGDLPTGGSRCYVATAAARGHPWLTGARDGVTRQLAVLKLGELALAAARPELHRSVRRAYDRLGPAAARQLGSPWLADIAYLLLKPLEWLTGAWLLVGALLGRGSQRG